MVFVPRKRNRQPSKEFIMGDIIYIISRGGYTFDSDDKRALIKLMLSFFARSMRLSSRMKKKATLQKLRRIIHDG